MTDRAETLDRTDRAETLHRRAGVAVVNLDTPEILGIVFACVAGALLALWSWRRGGGHKDGPLAQGELVIATWLPLIEWTPTVTLLIVAPSVVVGTIGWASPPA